MHYYKFNIGDYASHTRHLSLMEDLAYRRLLDIAYTSEKPLTKDAHALSRLIGMREYQSEVEDILCEFFEEVEEGWIHGRVLKEIDEASGRSDKAKVAAKARWECKRNADAMQMQCLNDATSINNNASSIENDATQDQLHTTQDQLPITQDTLPKTKKTKSTKGDTNFVFVLPEWIDKTQWDLWLKSRKKKMIPEQMQAQIDKLAEWRNAGLDHCGALSNAARNGYAGLFIPDEKKSSPANTQSFNDQAREGARVRLFGEKIN